MSSIDSNDYKFPGVFECTKACVLVISAICILSFIKDWPDGLLKTVLSVLASFIGVSVVVSMLGKYLSGKREWESRRNEIRQHIKDEFDLHYGLNNRYGLSNFVDEMDYRSIFKGLGRGDELWWHDTYCPDYNIWLDDLCGAVGRGAIIYMLIQSPGCQNAKHRAREIGGDIGMKYLPDLQQFLEFFIHKEKELKGGQEDHGGALHIKTYSDLPSMPIYLVCRYGKPHHAYTSFFLGKATGLGFPHMRWDSTNTDFVMYLKSYLEEKWNNIDSENKPAKCDTKV
jgi:hypothetical protein